MEKIKVLIVDEYLAVRRALAARLSSVPHIDVIATAIDIREGMDVILLELKGTSTLLMNPVSEMHQALAGHPAGIIVLTSYAEDDEREAALAAGASRYLLKHVDTARLLSEIEAVAAEIDQAD
jgi:DNA-binding NarL/FixJ family response regulator